MEKRNDNTGEKKENKKMYLVLNLIPAFEHVFASRHVEHVFAHWESNKKYSRFRMVCLFGYFFTIMEADRLPMTIKCCYSITSHISLYLKPMFKHLVNPHNRHDCLYTG